MAIAAALVMMGQDLLGLTKTKEEKPLTEEEILRQKENSERKLAKAEAKRKCEQKNLQNKEVKLKPEELRQQLMNMKNSLTIVRTAHARHIQQIGFELDQHQQAINQIKEKMGEAGDKLSSFYR